jgi:hypothetical protein
MAVSITQTANPAGVAASSNIATYSSVSIGAEAADRIIAVLVGTELASSTPSACTIDYGSGDTAMNAAVGGNFGAMYTQIFYLLVPTGTTATIKVTYSSTNPANTANHIAVYRVIGATPTLSASGSDGSTDMDATDPLTTGSTTIPTDGAFLAVAVGATDTAGKTWSNATEDLDIDAGAFRFTTAMHTTAGTATRTCTGSTNGEDGALSYVIFAPNVSPTVSLNSPSDGGSTTDTTPDLTFTGTDTESNDIRYNIQVDTVNTFDSQGASYTFGTETFESGSPGVFDSVGNVWGSPTATLDTTSKVTGTNSIKISSSGPGSAIAVKDLGSTQTDLYLQIKGFIPSGFTFGADGYTGFLAFRSSIDNNIIAFNIEDYGSIRLTVVGSTLSYTDTGINLPTNSVFTLEVRAKISATVGNVSVWLNNSTSGSPDYNSGNVNTGSTAFQKIVVGAHYAPNAHSDWYFDNVTANTSFIGSGGVGSPLINAVSGTDAGFSGSPDNTDPFASGQQVTYTVQSALTDTTTYYWRVRGIDPSGSNAYGAWSSTRSFTVSTGGGGGPTYRLQVVAS